MQIHDFGYTETKPALYEEDHLIALSIGGAPDNPLNLWPQPRNSEWGAAKKDQLEIVLYKKVCANKISLSEAQRAMATNWIKAWSQYVHTHPESYELAKNTENKNGNENYK